MPMNPQDKSSRARQDKCEGLSEEEALLRLASDGPNEIPSARKSSFLHTVVDVLREPMLLLLASIAVVYAFFGEPTEAITMGAAVFVVLGLTVVQERRTERALSALRSLSSARARVLREGEVRVVTRSSVVEGDLVMLSEGERVPADGVVLESMDLAIDESTLTGESVPVVKRNGEDGEIPTRPGGDDTPFVYSGTLVVRGHGVALIKQTGSRSEMGRIGTSLQNLDLRTSPLHQESRRLVFVLASIGTGLCLLAFATFGLRDRQWVEGLLVGLTMAISIVPEEIPVVFTILMALGAWRIAKSKVLTRRLPAIETLGSATTLCVDKTGTLTQNRMAVAKVVTDGDTYDLSRPLAEASEAIQRLIRYSVLASRESAVDPMERALWRFAEQLNETPHVTEKATKVLAEYGLSPSLLAVSYLWRQEGGATVVATKGAPEAVAELCGLEAEARETVYRQMRLLASEGLRVLAVAAGEWPNLDLPSDHRDLKPQFLGLVGLADPVREGVPEAIHECQAAGIRVVMITGDHPATASNIARQIGLRAPDEVVTGAEIAELSESELHRKARQSSVYARVMPEQKLRLVLALQAIGEVVAMTGDGVNDAPALRAADIGIAMGGRGTDVAREAADLVLLDDDFSSIVRAIRLGRQIFDNLRHAIAYIVAIHVPIAGLTVVPVLLGMPIAFLPVHIVLLEMTVDPACATVFESQTAEEDLMSRPPRSKHARLLDRPDLLKSLSEGATVLAATLGTYLWTLAHGSEVTYARTLTFGVLIVANLSLISINTAGSRSLFDVIRRPSKALASVLIGTLAGLGFLFGVPAIRTETHFAAPSPADILLMLGLGLGSVLWLEFLKSIGRHRQMQRSVQIP